MHIGRQYTEAADVNWYKNRMPEEFRDADRQPRTLVAVKRMLRELETDI